MDKNEIDKRFMRVAKDLEFLVLVETEGTTDYRILYEALIKMRGMLYGRGISEFLSRSDSGVLNG